MVFICTNSCAKYNCVELFLYQSCKSTSNNVLQAFDNVTINRHIYVAKTVNIIINSNDLQVSLVPVGLLLDSNIGSPDGFTGCMCNEVSS